jgi:hypothetical protein
MRIKFLSAVLGVALTATAMSASAQKAYTEGTISASMIVMGNPVEAKTYFTADSIATAFTAGPATIKMLANTKHTYFAQLVDVPAFNVKKAAVYTPDEVDQAMNALPVLTFAPSTETKQISGFNCKKVVATDTKDNKTFDIWVTNDISVPSGVIPSNFAKAGGFPIQYVSFYKSPNGLAQINVTVTAVSSDKAPKGTFAIGSDYDKVSKDDMDAMARGGQ